jgi:hypothetical protein
MPRFLASLSLFLRTQRQSAEPVAAVAHGLQVVAEGTNRPSSMLLAAWLRVRSSQDCSIVAVHGLNGHREKTWTADNNINWLRDLLPHDLPNARILSWGYDANTQSSSRVSTQNLHDHSLSLVSDLCLDRRMTNVRNERGTMYNSKH